MLSPVNNTHTHPRSHTGRAAMLGSGRQFPLTARCQLSDSKQRPLQLGGVFGARHTSTATAAADSVWGMRKQGRTAPNRKQHPRWVWHMQGAVGACSTLSERPPQPHPNQPNPKPSPLRQADRLKHHAPKLHAIQTIIVVSCIHAAVFCPQPLTRTPSPFCNTCRQPCRWQCTAKTGPARKPARALQL